MRSKVDRATTGTSAATNYRDMTKYHNRSPEPAATHIPSFDMDTRSGILIMELPHSRNLQYIHGFGVIWTPNDLHIQKMCRLKLMYV